MIQILAKYLQNHVLNIKYWKPESYEIYKYKNLFVTLFGMVMEVRPEQLKNA